MKTRTIIDKINTAIKKFIASEKDILVRKLNERTLSNRLTDYLRPLFNDYNVESEYNGDMDKPNDRKALEIARNKIIEIGYKPNTKNNYKITPDIIIHIRNTNTQNLVVIEVKKDISPKNDKSFDLIKLQHLTINYEGNHYNYRIGIAIILGTGKKAGEMEIFYYQNGNRVEEQNLL